MGTDHNFLGDSVTESATRKRNARRYIAAGLLIAFIGIGILAFGTAVPSQLRAWGVILSLAGVLLSVRGLYRYLAKERAPSQPLPPGELSLDVEQKAKRKENPKVTAVLWLLTVVFFFVGSSVASSNLTPEKGGELAGHAMFYEILALLALGGLLKLTRTPYAWESAAFVISLLAMAIVISLSGDVARSQDQNKKSDAAIISLVTQLAGVEPIQVAEYPESAYGRFGTVLTAMNRDLSQIQHRKIELMSRQANIGPLGFDSPGTFADAAKRSEALRKVAILRDINTGAIAMEQDLLKAVYADVNGSTLTADEKRQFLEGFNKGANGKLEEATGYFKLALQIDDVAEDMLDIAASDHPSLVGGHLMFSRSDALTRFQTDSAKAKTLTAQLQELQASMSRERTAYLKAHPVR